MRKTTVKKRKYIRINSVLAVEFYLTDKFGRRLTPYLQGFTNNIGKGGICLVANDLWWGLADKLKEGERIAFQIEVPFRKDTVLNYGRIIWKSPEEKKGFLQYRMGVEFEPSALYTSLFLYALIKRLIPYMVSIIMVGLTIFAFNAWMEEEALRRENQKLLISYHRLLGERDNLYSNIEKQKEFVVFLDKRKEELAKKITQLKEQLVFWQKKYNEAVGKEEGESLLHLKNTIDKLKQNIKALESENIVLKRQLTQSKTLTSLLNITLDKKNEEFSRMSTKVVEGMYNWIKNRQDLHTGLVLSYEGDKLLNKAAFSYDEALAAIIFTIHRDFLRARMILDFYLEKVRAHEPIYNAYYTDGGVYEYVVHSGVNAWVGLAALYYMKYAGGERYMDLVRHVSDFLIKMMDDEGGIKGGPGKKWYSTEHNLDAYAFFRLFYELSRKEEYFNISKKIAQWLDRYAYTHFPLPVNRGKGDATIATDTYAWSVTALGPQELIKLGMDADEIIDFALKNCVVKTVFKSRGKEINVEGFDFARARNIGRGGVVSCEWTAQMILAFEIMADYYKDKNPVKFKYYLNKALFYAKELEKMIIISPSPIGKANPTLPYASSSYVDTGHGWRTPKGDRVGSLSATAYFLIAYYGVNPLRASTLTISLKDIYEERSSFSYTKAD